MSWAAITAEGKPVRGNVAAFEAAARSWRDTAIKAESVRDSFRGIVAGEDAVGLQGEAADAFRTVVKESQDVLDNVPEELEVLGFILADHGRKLRGLRQEADAALNRATIAKAERDQAQRQQDQSEQRVASLQAQIRSLSGATDDPSVQRRTTLEGQLVREKGVRNRARNDVDASVGKLNGELKKWSELRSREDELNRITSRDLDEIALRRLRNPGLIDQIGGYLTEKVLDFVEDVAKLLDALVRGDWEEFLWHLRDVLDQLLDVVAIVGIIVLAVSMAPVSGGASLLIAFMWLGAGLGLAKLTSEAILYGKGAVNEDTGETIGAMDLVVSGGFVILELMHLGKARFAFHGAGQMKNVVARKMLDDKRGIVYKNFGDISFKQTLKLENAPRKLAWELSKDTARDTAVDWADLSGGEEWFGVRPNPNYGFESKLRKEIDAIKRGERGLTIPIDTYLVGAY